MSEKEKQEKTLRIFELCKELTSLLGEKEAIADLKELYDRHPEMFKDMKDVSQIINEVVSKPEIIVDARREEKYDVYKAIKQLNDKKMGDVIIKNQNGTNEIFHANQKKISELTRFKKNLPNEKNLVGGGDAHSPHPDFNKNQNQVWATDISSMCSPTLNSIIPQNSNFDKEKFEKFSLEKKVQVVGTPTSYTQAQSLDGLVDNNISPAKNIIPQNQNQSQESLGKNNPSDSKQEKMNALREQVNNIVKNRTTNSFKDLSLKIDREK